jgi:hypothetical protein
MYSTYSNEGLFQKGLRDLGVSISFVCTLSGGPSPSLVSLWLNGTKQLDDSVTRPLVETLRMLKEISQLASPWPLSFRDCRLWQKLLADYRANTVERK